MSETEPRLNLSSKTPRDEWPERYRRVAEYFEATEDLESFESGGRYPDKADPYVLHASTNAPLRPDGDTEYSWHILLNPWSSPASREAWIIDGRPLLPKETAHGAPDDGIVANDRDIVDIHSNRVVVCVALTKVAGIHSRAENWIHCDEQIEAQFDQVLAELEDEIN